ncbi:MAG: polysaccharide biosynthesis/export family protein [Fimbriiglobus sp.]
MTRRFPRLRLFGLAAGAAMAALSSGCQTAGAPRPMFSSGNNAAAGVASAGKDANGERVPHIHPAHKAGLTDNALMPKELVKVTMPPYTVEAPDILLIDAQRLIPLPPYRIEPQDVLYIFVPKALEDFPINGPYPVDPDGTVNLGPTYGAPLRVNDMTVAEAEKAINTRLAGYLTEGKAVVSLAQAKGVQQIRGEHLIRPDGTVSLGLYGNVYVAGMTLNQVKQAVEQHLSKFVYRPEVSVDVSAYNSKYYYVITDYAGAGEQVVRIPATGNETVLDAVSMIGGLSPVSSKRIWIARPAPAGSGDQILPVDWQGITRRGTTASNYQVLPGDRVFVMARPLSKLDTTMGRLSSPLERVFSTALIGSTTVGTIESGGLGIGGGVR